jgi:transcriptional regulator with XRE-family HTH domain
MTYNRNIDVNKSLHRFFGALWRKAMANKKEIVRANLVKLRKEHKFTQMELAEKIGYSDKAISRWETGEVNPDIETLDKLATLYEIDISVFFTEYNARDYKAQTRRDIQLGKRIAVWLLMIAAFWYIGIMIFVYSKTFDTRWTATWLIFIWMIPITFALCYLLNIKWGNRFFGLLFASGLCWSLLTAVYLQFIEYNVYLLFISGVPLQVALFLLSYMRTKK